MIVFEEDGIIESDAVVESAATGYAYFAKPRRRG